MMHSLTGDLTFQAYGKDESEVIYSISRAELNIALINAAEEHGARIHFQQRCVGIDLRGGDLRLRDDVSGEERLVRSDSVIGCDGSASAIRSEMLRLPRFNFSQQYLDYGYKELTIPAGSDGVHAIEAHALHIWPRGNYMLIALPNMDGTFACILFLPFEGGDGFAVLDTRASVRQFFQSRFPDAVPLMAEVADNFFANPTGSMATIKCSPWHVDGRALLLGDAAHAIVPFFGQGINCGFEDCTVLLELLDRLGPDWEKVFSEFERVRKVNTDAIADLAVENFVEMRDRVADPRFLLRKKIELALENRYPKRFVPKYAMVTFHRVPYSTALHRGAVQDRILNRLCDGIERVEDLDWKAAESVIASQLPPLELS
jgi:kynurenine 3-monooxygenase